MAAADRQASGRNRVAGKVCRLLVWALIIFLAAILVLGLYARSVWHDWLAEHSIRTLEWQGISLSSGGVQLDRATLVRLKGGTPLSVHGRGLTLGWQLLPLTLEVLTIEELEVGLPSWPAGRPMVGNTSTASEPIQLPGWLPERVNVKRFNATLPGDIRVQGDITLKLALEPGPWRIETNETEISGPLQSYTTAGWNMQGIRFDLAVSGVADPEELRVTLLAASRVRARRIERAGNGSTIGLEQVVANLAGLELGADYLLMERSLQALRVSGPANLRAGSVNHPSLVTQPWDFQGRVDGSLTRVTLKGILSGQAGLAPELTVAWPLEGVPELYARAQLSGSNTGQALAGTFSGWPSGLETTGGQLGLQARVRFPETAPDIEATVRADGLSGLFRRAAWNGLSGALTIRYSEKLVARTSELALERLNPGIPLGPISVNARYQAQPGQPAAGAVSLLSGRAGFMGGEIWVKPGEWKLSSMPLRVPVELNSIQLSQLLQAYPAEGLAGTGTLEGSIPLVIGPGGVQVEKGLVKARPPGGTLALPAERLQALAQNNQTMELVVRALQNFNYTRLRSTIDYAQNGTLNLGLHLEGSNPNVRDGYPVVVNINLQEDVPALMTSLQLSGRVNEAVTEKVRSLMQKREAGQ